MKNCPINGNGKEAFRFFAENLTESVTTWSYFVNWEKVFKNIKKIEPELWLLNSLIGKKNLKKEAIALFQKYPNTIKAVPFLLGIRNKSLKILIDVERFFEKEFNFDNKSKLTEKKAEEIWEFLEKTGIAELIENGEIMNLKDYSVGVEVGIDSNARKNRTGKLMEQIVENYVAKACLKFKSDYIRQANRINLKEKWGIEIEIDKSSRKIDFAVLTKNKKLIFIETNFYGGGGSKLKSTAGEYITMSQFWKKQGIKFVWITDGKGWKNILKPLEEFYEKNRNLLNLKMLQLGCLEKIIKETEGD